MLSALFPSICPYGTQRLSLEGLSWNFVFGIFLLKFISTSWLWLKRDKENGELPIPVWLMVMVGTGCFVCQVRTETQEAVGNGNTQSSMMDCNLLGFDVPKFTRNGLWSAVNQLQGCGEIVLCVLVNTWIGTFQVISLPPFEFDV